MNARMESIEKKIVTLENEIKALRTEFEDATRAETKNTPAGVPPQIHPTPPPRVSAKSHSSWEWLVGGNLIGKLGIVTLILSAAFFMVYALDKGWLNPWTRIALLEIASAAAAYLSYRLYKKNYRYVPEALAIVALAASVIAIYSAHFIYHYIERIPTMLLMLGLMSLTLFYARRIRAQALTSVLFVGFFALPVIHSHNINETAAYFTYLFAVNILYTALVYFSLLRREHTLSPHTLWSVAAGNALSLLGWAQKFSEYSIIPLLFCAVTFTLLLWSAHQSQWSTDERSDKVLRNLAVFFVNLLYTVMTPTVLNLNKNFHSDIFALAYLALAALNVTAVDFLALRTRSIAAAATSVVLLLTLAMVIFLHGGAERLALAVFLTAVMYMSARWPDKLVYYVTAYLNLLNLLVVFGSVQSNADNVFLLNWQAATLFTYAAGATYLLTRKLWPSAFNFGTLLAITALLTSFVGIIAELNRLFQDSDTRLLIATLLLAVYALVLLTLGFKRHSVAMRKVGLIFMGLAVLKFYLVDIWFWDKSVRIIAGVILGGGLVVISFYYEKFREKFKDLAAILFVVGVFSLSSPAEAAAKATATAAPPVIADTALSWPLYAAFWVIFAVIVWRMFFIFRKDKV